MKNLSLRLLFTLCAALVLHTGVFAGVLNGSCGDNATWSYDTDTQTLTIAGSGDMYDYEYDPDSRPWNDYSIDIRYVIIGDEITHIGSSSFKEFPFLISVLIGERVQSIGNNAFQSANLNDCPCLYIPNSVESIGEWAFSESQLKHVCIGSGLNLLSMRAFLNCRSLISIAIYAPNPVQIDEAVFEGCGSLESIFVPVELVSTYQTVFARFDYGQKFKVPSGNCGDDGNGNLSDNVQWSYDMTKHTLHLSGTGNIIGTDYASYPWNDPVFNPKVTIDKWDYYTGIESVTMDNGITNLPSEAFYRQMTLTSIQLSTGLLSIGDCALSECAFTSIVLPDGLQTINGWAFQDAKLTSIDIPATVSSISQYAFSGCSAMTTANFLGTTPPSLGTGAFDTDFIKAIYVPAGCVDTYKRASGWSAYTTLIQEYTTTTFTYTAPSKIEAFDAIAKFTGATGVQSHEFADGQGTVVYFGTVTDVWGFALEGSALTGVVIPESVEQFGRSAFGSCSSLASVTFAGTPQLFSIGEDAFADCGALTSFHVPASVSDIGYGFLRGCPITSLTVDGANQFFSDQGCNGIFSKDGKTLIRGLTSTTIHSDVQTIDEEAFMYEGKPFTLTLPESVTTIGEQAFHQASGLTAINIPAAVSNIASDAFVRTTGLQDIYCYRNMSGDMSWLTNNINFISSPRGSTNFHVDDATSWQQQYANANVTFVGDLGAEYDEVAVSDAGVATYCSSFDLDFTGLAVQAYVATAFDGDVLSVEPVMKVPAHTGILLVGPADSYQVPRCDDAETVANLLAGTTAQRKLKDVDGDYTNFILAVGTSGDVGFYPVRTGNIAAHKAWLPLPTAQLSGSSPSIAIRIGDATGMQPLLPACGAQATSDEWYDLSGRRLNRQPTAKGLYLHHGRKILIN